MTLWGGNGLFRSTGCAGRIITASSASVDQCGTFIADQHIALGRNVASDPRYLRAFGSTRSQIIVPVFDEARETVGTIDVESEEPHFWIRRCRRSWKLARLQPGPLGWALDRDPSREVASRGAPGESRANRKLESRSPPGTQVPGCR